MHISLSVEISSISGGNSISYYQMAYVPSFLDYN
jgi:hypothetical protein